MWLVSCINETGAAAVYGPPVYGAALVSETVDIQAAPLKMTLPTGYMVSPEGQPLIAPLDMAAGKLETSLNPGFLAQAPPMRTPSESMYGASSGDDEAADQEIIYGLNERLVGKPTLVPHFRFYGNSLEDIEQFIENTQSEEYPLKKQRVRRRAD